MMKVLKTLVVFILSVFSLTAQETLMLKADQSYIKYDENTYYMLGKALMKI